MLSCLSPHNIGFLEGICIQKNMFLFNVLKFFLCLYLLINHVTEDSWHPFFISTINREHVFINALSSNKMKHFISLGGLSTDPLLKLLPSSPATGFHCSLFSLRFNITFLLSFPYLPLPSPSTLSLRTIFIASSLFFPQIDLTFYTITLV